MINLRNKIIGAAATAAIIGTTFAASAFADTNVEISGNGSRSDNNISVSSEHRLTVTQTNNANISNNVEVNSNTGNNSASGNTGGDVSINTGDAETHVGISNFANLNSFSMEGCGCGSGDIRAKIHGNGSKSDNSIDINEEHTKNISQHNNADFDNNVEVNANTGDNSAGNNGNSHHNYPKHDYDKNHDYDKDKDHNKGYSHDNKDKDYGKDRHEYNKDRDYGNKHENKDNKGQYHSGNDSKGGYDHKYQPEKKVNYDSKNYDRKHDYEDKRAEKKKDKKHNSSNNHSGNRSSFDWNKYRMMPYWWNHGGSNGNTGGNTSITTGNVTTSVYIQNLANANFLTL